MHRPDSPFKTATLVGIDGSGKSTTAHASAKLMSETFQNLPVRVTDNDGIYDYYQGIWVTRYAEELEGLQSDRDMGRIRQLAHLAAFTVGRRAINSFHHSGLHISVRDPHRIDPAIYAGIYKVPVVGKLPPAQRFEIFNRLTLARPFDAVIELALDPQYADLKNDRDRDMHESYHNLYVAAEELPIMKKLYSERYGSMQAEITAQQPLTTDNVVNALCSIVRP